MGQRDLGREQRGVVGHVGPRVAAAVLELDSHADAQLLQIDLVSHPQALGQAGDLFWREARGRGGHRLISSYATKVPASVSADPL